MSTDLDALIAVYDTFDDAEATSARNVSVQEKLTLLESAELAAKVISALRRQLTKDIAGILDRGTADVPDYGVVEVRYSISRTQWEHDALRNRVVALMGEERDLLVDPETGELHPPSQIVAGVVRRFCDFASPTWKVGDSDRGTPGIRTTYGLEPGEFCKETANPTVKVLTHESEVA